MRGQKKQGIGKKTAHESLQNYVASRFGSWQISSQNLSFLVIRVENDGEKTKIHHTTSASSNIAVVTKK